MDANSIVAGFDSTLPEQERILEAAAHNVKTGLERDSAIYKSFTQLQFFVLSVDFDMRVMLRSLLVNPQNRLTAEKFLVLTLQEAVDSIGKMSNALKAEFRKSARAENPDSGANLFSEERFDEANAALKTSLASMRDNKEFMETLRLIRNTVSGHIVGDDVGIQNTTVWVLSRENAPRTIEGVMGSQIVAYAIEVLHALTAFAKGLTASVNSGR